MNLIHDTTHLELPTPKLPGLVLAALVIFAAALPALAWLLAVTLTFLLR